MSMNISQAVAGSGSVLAEHLHLLGSAQVLRAAHQPEKLPLREEIKKWTSKDGLWRLLSATMTILNHTHAELERTQEKLSDLELRVSHLETLASTDEMTGLKNRRGFDDAFAQELDRTNRGLSGGGVMVLLDLDNFKMINDTYSHLAGDACLKLVSRTIEGQVRVIDTAARLGGDEFIIMLTDTCKEQVLERIQTLIKQLNNMSLIWQGVEIPLRASIGIKEYGQGETSDDIYRAADNAMYRNKASKKVSNQGVSSPA